MGAPGVIEGGSRPGDGRPAYAPGLDGLRAVSLLGVLAFHHRFPWAPGGFLGVSTFFTLSGFLIARLALAERASTGGLALGRFWERRARRLLPAALVTVAGIAVLQATAGVGAGPSLRGDLLATLGYVANWRFVASSGDYANMFADPSPVAHMWSLAIEEQFYLAFPLVFALLTRFGHRWAAAAFAAAGATSFGAAALASAGGRSNTGLAYYGTHTRAGEVLAGVVLAFLVAGGPLRRALASPAGRRAAAVAAPVALAGLAALWHATTLGSPGLFRGVTALNAALTCVVVVALASPAPAPGPLGAVLGWWPLRRLGQVSYGAYLLHWPVFLVLDPERTGLGPGERLFAARLAATVTLAAVLHVVVEAPVRFRLRVPRRRLAAGLAAAGAVVVTVVVAVPAGTPDREAIGPAASAEDRWEVPAPAGAPKVLLLGDSVAWSLGPAFHDWNDAHADAPVAVEGWTPFGCPLGGHDVPVRVFGDEWAEWAECARWHAGLPDVVGATDADVILFTSGVFELGERRFADDWYHVGERPYDAWLRDVLEGYADLFASAGVPVVWTTFPHVRIADESDPTRPWDELAPNDPARVDRLNELVREVVAGRPGFAVLDLEAWTRTTMPGGEFDPDMRDGTHYSWAAAEPLGEWLVPELRRVLAAA